MIFPQNSKMCKEKYLTNRKISDRLNFGKGKTLYRRGNMEWIVEQTLLYDFYGELLTEHQKEIYEDHVLNDLSPSEIAGEHGITRQAAYDMIRRRNKILAGYERKLHLVEKFLRTKEKVSEIHLLAKSILDAEDQEQMKTEIRKIEQVSNGILEDL